MAEAQAQPYDSDFRAILLTMLAGTAVVSVGEQDLHDAESTSSD
jgi:hypothetical protein